MSTTDHRFQRRRTLPGPGSITVTGIAHVLGRYRNFPSTSCELNFWGFTPFSVQNKMVLAWAALSFPLQTSNGLTTQRSPRYGLFWGMITEEAEDWFWEYFTGLTLFSQFHKKLFYSCNNLSLCQKKISVSWKMSPVITHCPSNVYKGLKLHVCLHIHVYTDIICACLKYIIYNIK